MSSLQNIRCAGLDDTGWWFPCWFRGLDIFQTTKSNRLRFWSQHQRAPAWKLIEVLLGKLAVFVKLLNFKHYRRCLLRHKQNLRFKWLFTQLNDFGNNSVARGSPTSGRFMFNASRSRHAFHRWRSVRESQRLRFQFARLMILSSMSVMCYVANER